MPAMPAAPTYQETTRAVTVTIQPEFLDNQSDPDEGHYVWAYHVRIENNGSETVQLVTRHWQITDGRGKTQEVRGAGVIGEQPILKPGEAFEYSSGTPLATPTGFMQGSYQMATPDGTQFDATVPAFSLDSPYETSPVH